MRRTLAILFALSLVAAAAGCGDDDAATTETSPATTAAAGTEAPATTGAPETTDSSMPPADTTPPETGPENEAPTELIVFSSAFEDGGTIPLEYTCDGANSVPEVRFDGVPPGTASLALVVVDPDGGDWIHWAAWNIPPTAGGLAPGTPAGDLADGTRQAANDFEGVFDPGDPFPGGGEVRIDGWDGPCPGPGDPHRYVFTAYALTGTIDLPTGTPGHEILDAVEAARADGSLIGEASITGLYSSG